MKYFTSSIIIISILSFVPVVHAQRPDAMRERMKPRVLLSPEKREAVKEARLSGEYDNQKDIFEDLGIELPRPKNKLNDEQKAIIQELKEEGDSEAVKAQLDEWGIVAPDGKENRGLHLGQRLTEEQRETLVDLRKEGDKEAVEEQLEAWGIEKPEPRFPQFLRRMFQERLDEQGDADKTVEETVPTIRRFFKRFLKKQGEQE